MSRLIVTLLAAAAPLHAQSPAAGIETAVRAAIANEWAVAPDSLRLDWHDAVPPDASSPRVAGSGSAGYWTVIVEAGGEPVRLRVRAGVERIVPVAARELQRGATLLAEDIRLGPLVTWGAPEPVRLAGAGWSTRRLVREGEPLLPPAVAPPDGVRAGDEVEVVWSGGAVAVTLRGRAATTAGIGESAEVRLDGRGRVLGRVEAPGVVRLNVNERGSS